LVVDPNPALMELAVTAGRLALCALEWPTLPLRGWAMETEAENLLTGKVTPDSRTEEQKKLFEHLATVGNNGWGGDYGQRILPGMLAELLATGIEPDIILTTMFARDASSSGIEKLQHYLTKLQKSVSR